LDKNDIEQTGSSRKGPTWWEHLDASLQRGMQRLLQGIGYTLSLPERLVRAAAVLTAGLSKEVAEALFPQALLGSNTYQVMVRNFQQFVLTKLGEPDEATNKQAPSDLPEDYLWRKAASNVLEAAGLLAVRFSPLWVFAIGSDLTAAGEAYTKRLRQELQQQGLIDKSDESAGIEQVLAAMNKSLTRTVGTLDLPPLNAADAKRTVEALAQDYGAAIKQATGLLFRIEKVKADIEEAARRESVPVTQIAGLLAIKAAETVSRTTRGGVTAGQVASRMLLEQIVDSYADSLARLRRAGFQATVAETMQPHLRSAARQLAPALQTFTEKLWSRWTG